MSVALTLPPFYTYRDNFSVTVKILKLQVLTVVGY